MCAYARACHEYSFSDSVLCLPTLSVQRKNSPGQPTFSIFYVTLKHGSKFFEPKFILKTEIIPVPQFSQKKQNFYKVEYLSGPYEESSDKFENILKVILSYAAEVSASWQHCSRTWK